MQDIVLELLRQQQGAGFPDLRGTEATATIPIGDRLINEFLARALPKDRSVQEVTVQSEAGGQLTVRVRVTTSTLLPAIGVALVIDEQPQLPARPVLGLRLSGIPKLLMLTGVLERFRGFLPPGVTIEGEHVRVNFERLLKDRGQADVLRHLTTLNVTTRDGAVVVAVSARIEG